MTLAELLKELINTSKERLKSPITSTYIITFILWNWRPLSILFFERISFLTKIEIIDQKFYNTQTFLIPLLISILYISCIPYISLLIDLVVKPAETKRYETIYERKSNDLDEQIKLVNKELELQDKKNRNKTVLDLENKIEELNVIINSKNKEIEKQNFRILMIRSEFKQTDFKYFSNILINNIDNHKIESIPSKLIDFLVQNDFININESNYKITNRGVNFFKFIQEKVREKTI